MDYDYINFFCHEQFSERLIIFNEGYSMVHRFTIGCVIGDDKILVIDAGLGMSGDLRRYIEGVVGANKPIICACTHGHLDHVGSACLFDEAYCSLLDFDNPAMSSFDPVRRLADLEDFGLDSKIVNAYGKKHLIVDNTVQFKDIKDGDVFDLGGVKLEAIAVPGHSKGSMAFINRAEKYVFTGDAVNLDTHLKRMDRAGFVQYKETLKRFISIVGDDVTLYPAHLPLPMTIDIAKNLVQICDELLAGKIEKDPPGETVFKGRQNNRDQRMHYVNNTCIVYNRSLLQTPPQMSKPMSSDLCFYSHEKWTDRIYTVTINFSMVHRITAMVFVGDNKILCIDSGHGIDMQLRPYIESFAGKGKPILLACTHIGIDHGGGAVQFDECYVNHNDWPSIERSLPRAKRLEDVQPFALYNEEFWEYTKENMCEAPAPGTFKDIVDGDVFELGGIEVQCILTPGHTKGHMAFYCRDANIAFTGDAMNVDTHLKSMDRQGFRDYVAMLQRFMSIVNEDTMIFSSHLNRPHKMRVPRNILAACLELSDGQTYGDPPGEAIQKHLTAYNNPDIRMHYHGNCCVVYNAAKLI